jgi:ribosomal protein S18 acetylase RimI-like enzyme
MVVKPSHRGSGGGAQLLRAAIDLAETKGLGRVTLLTDSDNEAAQRFYARHGFVGSTMRPMRLQIAREAQ